MPRRRRITGPGTPYTDEEEAELADYLAELDYWDVEEAVGEETGTIDVEAQIEWSGDIDNNTRDGVRRTRLANVPLTEIRDATERLRRAQRTGPSQPYKSYTAKSWRAQLRQLQRTKRGRAISSEAGLRPQTTRRWRTGKQAPSPASRQRIAEAYETMRNPRPAAVRKAEHNLAGAFTRALESDYNATVRLRDIRHLWIQRDRP